MIVPFQGEDTGSDGAEEECEDGEANEAAEEEERERQRRIEESLRKREEEVQRALAGHLRDRDKERMQHKHDEAVHNFNALLADLVSLALLVLCARCFLIAAHVGGSSGRIECEGNFTRSWYILALD